MAAGHAVITGGSSGIGLALGRRLVVEGYDLTILARDPARLAAAQAELATGGGRVGVHVADVADADAVATAMRAAIVAFGSPTLLVANAGMVIPGRFDALPLEAFHRTMAVNYLGAVHLIHAALPAMQERRAGHIVLVSSGAALVRFYGYTAYAPTKCAVHGLAEALRSELQPDGLRVSVVFPPDTDTPQLHEDARLRPEPTSRIAGGAKVLSADQVALAILRGVRRGKFTIAPGWEMAALARLHSLVGPLLHRFWFDPVIARTHRAPNTR